MPRKAKTEQQKYEAKKKQLQVGLANNAFGAGAGLLATGAAVGGAKKLWHASKGDPNSPEHVYQQKKDLPKFMGKGKHGPVKQIRWGQALKKIPGPAKVAAGIGGAGLIGMQAVNAGMDAQSGAYFGNELRKLKKPASMQQAEKVGKSYVEHVSWGQMDWYESPVPRGTGIGFNIQDEPVHKSIPRLREREYARQRNVARAELAGYAGAAGLGIGGAKLIHGTVPWKEQLTPGKHAERMMFKEKPTVTPGSVRNAANLRPRGKFFGGAALLASAPTVAYLNRKAAQRGKQAWE